MGSPEVASCFFRRHQRLKTATVFATSGSDSTEGQRLEIYVFSELTNKTNPSILHKTFHTEKSPIPKFCGTIRKTELVFQNKSSTAKRIPPMPKMNAGSPLLTPL